MLFRQTRVGKDGVDFELLKLRTMVVGAEQKGAGYAVDAGDSRITRVGRILRKTSIDELPQLWNVLRGEMSLIGPRPTLRYQVEKYTERQRQAARRATRAHRLGAGARARDAAVGRADRARRLVRRAPLAPRRPEDSPADAARALRWHLQGARRAAGAAAMRLGRAQAPGLRMRSRFSSSPCWRLSCGTTRSPIRRSPGSTRSQTSPMHRRLSRSGASRPLDAKNYYTPPGFFLLAGGMIKLGEAIGADEPAQHGQLLNGFWPSQLLFCLQRCARSCFRDGPGCALLRSASSSRVRSCSRQARCSIRSRSLPSSPRSRWCSQPG